MTTVDATKVYQVYVKERGLWRQLHLPKDIYHLSSLSMQVQIVYLDLVRDHRNTRRVIEVPKIVM